jgi:hypothetical protein
MFYYHAASDKTPNVSTQPIFLLRIAQQHISNYIYYLKEDNESLLERTKLPE